MPRSQRNQKVSLTKTSKKGWEMKQSIVSEVRKCVDEYPSVYVFSFVNLRSKLLKEVRLDFREDSRFFMGKNKVMILALGKSEQDEYQDNLRQVSKRLKGQVGLLFTRRPTEEVKTYFKALAVADHAPPGFVHDATIPLPTGSLGDWPVSMMEQFRKLGVVVEVEEGVLVNRKAINMCTAGEPISPEGAKLLALYDKKIATFTMSLLCRWSEGEFEALAEGTDDAMVTE
ncbi:unnamed protein product [Ectocarpus sp. CCAP 1310/34]|nr:unnamed protein product [Ectocarpus sp. CCAP 1310/34]